MLSNFLRSIRPTENSGLVALCVIIRKGSECMYEREKMELSDCISLITVSSKERRYILAEANAAFDVVFTQLTGRLSSHVICPHIST